MMVNHQENDWEWQGRPFSVAPEQVITSLESNAKKCGKGISIQNVRTALKRFEKSGFLTDESTNRNRLITIVNWGVYHKLLTTNKNDREKKNEKENKNPKSKYYW
jgi:DNA replication protein DnaD